jgi:hypothetical protein
MLGWGGALGCNGDSAADELASCGPRGRQEFDLLVALIQPLSNVRQSP